MGRFFFTDSVWQIDATFIKELKKFVTFGTDFVFIFVIHAYFPGYIIFL